MRLPIARARAGRSGTAATLLAGAVLAATATLSAAGLAAAPASAAGGYGGGYGAGLSAHDRTFLTTAAQGGQFEITGGTLAGTRAASPAVRAFGARMVTDHGREAAQLRQLASRLGVSLPGGPDAHQREILGVWSTLTGGGFDCSYTPTEYTDHEGDIATYQDEAAHGTNARVRAFARAQLPILRQHLALAGGALAALSCAR
jgi:putative membrane protein